MKTKTKTKLLISLTGFLLFAFIIKAQISFEKADAHAANYTSRSTDVIAIATDLTKPFTSDIEKARAIFTWIALNISYDISKFLNNKPSSFTYTTEEEKVQKIREIHENGIKETLRKRKGVCEDYSNLFEKMCTAAGLKVQTISGSARTDASLLGKSNLKQNHAWNAIYINGKWKIVDATWGAGYVDFQKRKYHKQFKPEFFLIDPELSVMTHYPADEKNQFITSPVQKEKLATLPVAGYGFLRYGIAEYNPEGGLVKAGNEGEIIVKMKLSKSSPDRFLLIEGSKKSEMSYQKDQDGYHIFRLSTRGRINRIFTIAGVNGTEVFEILSYKII